eukprot:14549801-Heterocapsa_arctica.AAC.1
MTTVPVEVGELVVEVPQGVCLRPTACRTIECIRSLLLLSQSKSKIDVEIANISVSGVQGHRGELSPSPLYS